MPATYSGDPGRSQKDELRFLIGDVDMEDPLLSDEEIGFILSDENSMERAIISALERIVHRLANEVSTALGPSRIEAQHRYRHYKELMTATKKQASLKRASVYSGGQSVSQKRSVARSTDRVQPYFTREMGGFYGKPRP